MKKIITIASMLFVLTAGAQTKVTKDAHGNYVVAKRDTQGANKATGHTIMTRDGKTYPVYISINGKLFYYRVSKRGNTYKCYIKEN